MELYNGLSTAMYTTAALCTVRTPSLLLQLVVVQPITLGFPDQSGHVEGHVDYTGQARHHFTTIHISVYCIISNDIPFSKAYMV